MATTGIDYRIVLNDLKKRRAKLGVAIEAIEGILGDSSSSEAISSLDEESPTESEPIVPSGIYADMTIANAAVHFIGVAGQPLLTGAIVGGLLRGGLRSNSKSLYRTLYNTLASRLDKDVVKIGKKWGLRVWPNN